MPDNRGVQHEQAVRSPSTASPEPSRPHFTPGYGISPEPEGMLAWEDVSARLTASRNYWVGTTCPDGRPHSAPVWGVWLDNTLVFGTDPGSRKGRNLAADPRTTVHLESGDDVVILDGETHLEGDRALVQRASDAYKEKYGLGLLSEEMPPAAILAFRPTSALAWREQDFPKTATRWRLGGG